MAKDWGWISGTARSESDLVDCQQTINLYPEVVESGRGRSRTVLYSVPGFADWCTLPIGNLRGMFAQDGKAFAVSGGILYQLNSDKTYTARGGGIVDDGSPVTISSNGDQGHQLFIPSAGHRYIFDTNTNTFTEVLGADGLLHVGCFVDQYFLGLDRTTGTMYASALENGLTWAASAKSQRNTTSDRVIGMATMQRLVYLLGSKRAEVWYNSGTWPFAFAPFQGGFMETGCAAQDSVAVLSDAGNSGRASTNLMMWLACSPGGGGYHVVRVSGFQAQRVSDHAMEAQIAEYSTVSDAKGWFYEDRGHTFYILNFPTANHTWCFDTATGLWHERGWWNAGTMAFDYLRGCCHCFAFDKHLVGDPTSGKIFEMSKTVYTDADGVPLRRVRQGPYICEEWRHFFIDLFRLDIETGYGDPTDPTAQWSATLDRTENGETYSQARNATLGVRGQYGRLVEWRGLGHARITALRAVISGNLPVAIADAYLSLRMGGY